MLISSVICRFIDYGCRTVLFDYSITVSRSIDLKVGGKSFYVDLWDACISCFCILLVVDMLECWGQRIHASSTLSTAIANLVFFSLVELLNELVEHHLVKG